MLLQGKIRENLSPKEKEQVAMADRQERGEGAKRRTRANFSYNGWEALRPDFEAFRPGWEQGRRSRGVRGVHGRPWCRTVNGVGLFKVMKNDNKKERKRGKTRIYTVKNDTILTKMIEQSEYTAKWHQMVSSSLALLNYNYSN